MYGILQKKNGRWWALSLIQQIPQDWRSVLQNTLALPSTAELFAQVEHAYHNKNVYPPQEKLFQALELTPFAQVKVVLLGQDPYFHAGEAEGLAFSVPKGVAIPSSLRNVHSALREDLGLAVPPHGHLASWATQGVLLLNTVLTVESREERLANGKMKVTAISHAGLGWEQLTNAILLHLSGREQPTVFLLWGKAAQSKRELINAQRHLILETVHPSGLSAWRGFRQCKHFSQANTFLEQHGLTPIDWQID